MNVPGSAASHSLITAECRQNRGDNGAFEEAVQRAKEQYDSIVAGWAEAPEQPVIHLILTVERHHQFDGSGVDQGENRG